MAVATPSTTCANSRKPISVTSNKSIRSCRKTERSCSNYCHRINPCKKFPKPGCYRWGFIFNTIPILIPTRKAIPISFVTIRAGYRWTRSGYYWCAENMRVDYTTTLLHLPRRNHHQVSKAIRVSAAGTAMNAPVGPISPVLANRYANGT